jgi:RNA polymerase sigma-B factor
LDERRRERLLRRYTRDHRPRDFEALVVSYRPLACALARRYSYGPYGDADLEQAACEGLVKALLRFEPERGTSFTSYAVPTILGEVRRHLRDTTWPAHVPRKVQERVRLVRGAGERHAALHGRPPTPAQLAAATHLTEEEVVEALTAASTARTTSLAVERADLDGHTLADRLGEVDPSYEQVECLTAIERAFPALPFDEQAVVRLHFGDELTHRQIAARLGVSRSQVGRLLGSALGHLREAAAA